MKKKIFIVIFAAALGMNSAFAAGAAEAGLLTLIEQTNLEQLVQGISTAINTYNSAMTAFQHLQYGIEMAEIAAKNLASFDPSKIHSLNDFTDFLNKQTDLEMRTEEIFKGISIPVGGTPYYLTDIMKTPEESFQAMYENLEDTLRAPVSEEERYKIWTQFGLSPQSYYYSKTWQDREHKLAEKVIAYADEGRKEEDRQDAEDVREIIEASKTDNQNALLQDALAMQQKAIEEQMKTKTQVSELNEQLAHFLLGMEHIQDGFAAYDDLDDATPYDSYKKK